MKIFLHKIELFVDRIIPYLLVILLAIITIDIFFSEIYESYHVQIQIIDYIIIAFFIVDLSFKYARVRKIPEFLRKYWLEIIAVFPFFLVARIFEEIAGIFMASEEMATVQSVVHEGTRAEEIAAKTGRSTRFARIIRPVARLPRFAKALHFFKKPKKHRHPHSRTE
jgi:hypothetical protein